MKIFIKRKITFFIIVFFAFSTISAQKFEQFYNIPHYYNSAFAGIEKCSDISFNNNFLPIVGTQNFYNNNLLLNLYLPKISGGLKFGVSKKTSPQNVFSSLNLAFAYSYHFKISTNHHLSLSLQSKYNQESFNSSNLIFPNMITPYSNIILSNNEPILNKTYRNFEFAGGFVLYNKNSYFSIYLDDFYSLYIEEKGHAESTVIFLTEKIIYQKRSKFEIVLNSAIFLSKNYYNFSTGIILKTKQLNFGLFSKQNLFETNLANGLETYFAYNYKNLVIAYSYDFYFGNLLKTKSSLHEIHLKLRFRCKEKTKNNTIICPAYKL